MQTFPVWGRQKFQLCFPCPAVDFKLPGPVWTVSLHRSLLSPCGAGGRHPFASRSALEAGHVASQTGVQATLCPPLLLSLPGQPPRLQSTRLSWSVSEDPPGLVFAFCASS